jgi:hypothetical protein
MSVNHFIQTVWSKKIQDDLEEKCKLVLDCTRDYEGDCQYAQTVKILAVGEPIIGNYIGQDIDIEEMSDSSQDLTVDVQKYFAFQVGNVDKAQSVPGLPEKFQQNAMNRLAITREKHIGALVAGKAQSSADEEAGNAVYKEGAKNVITAEAKCEVLLSERLMTDGHQDVVTDTEIILNGADSKARINSRSVAKGNSTQLFYPKLTGNADCFDHVQCDSIIMDDAKIRSIPEICANCVDARLVHEAAIGKIAGDQILKLMTLGLTAEEAEEKILNGLLK